MVVDNIDPSAFTFPGDSTLPDLLRQQAQERPDAAAVIFRDTVHTNRELVERSEELAARLWNLGVRGDTCVGLFAESSLELMVGVWGILSAGGAYLPLSPDYPADRLRYMLEDARADVVVCQKGLESRLARLLPPGTRVVGLTADGEPAPAPAEDGRTLSEDGQKTLPHHLAYVIHTSGSTGKPKGVMIEHQSIVSQLGWLRETHGIGPGVRVLQKTPMSFDAAQWEILAPALGATVVMSTPGSYRDPEELIRIIARHEVTALQGVPTLLQALLDTEELDRCTSLRQIFSGGEALSRGLARRLLDTLPGHTLVNLYGPTECTINASSFTVREEDLDGGPLGIAIGTPTAGTAFHILDDAGEPVATGESGELYISGVQLARGYLHRPDLTAERFVERPLGPDGAPVRLYRTGDVVHADSDGVVHFSGRADNQVKLRGFRVELDEIRLAIESHDWVRNAAVAVRDNPRTGLPGLVACVELSPREAALMDQGRAGAHHQSKRSKLQVKAQLSNPGLRSADDLAGRPAVDLPGRTPTPEQRRRVFTRKTYRFYEGEREVTGDDLLRLLDRRPAAAAPRTPAGLSRAELGEILRWFGQYHSEDRLLPKYGYASPGALYATQMYLETNGIAGLAPGVYYHHPVDHSLVQVGPASAESAPADAREPYLHLHFLGIRQAIEPVYRNNIKEVLEIETGHMVGLFEEVLPAHGLGIRDLAFVPGAAARLGADDEDYYLGTFALTPGDLPPPDDGAQLYVQAHPGAVPGLPAGQYHFRDGRLEHLTDELIERRHVIAINQRVYERSSFGITVTTGAREPWLQYIDLGRHLQRLQLNEERVGLMSAGYSSQSGNDLPAARRFADLLRTTRGTTPGPVYFFVGGRVSEEQWHGEDMKEDVVHMQGPAEMIRQDLAGLLPDYMVPSRVVVLDRLPLTANGKIDAKALALAEETALDADQAPFVAPRTATEKRIAALWQTAMKCDSVSVLDDFFGSGGNSLIAVSLVHRINRELGTGLPLQALFEAPTVERLAQRIDADHAAPASRLVLLHGEPGHGAAGRGKTGGGKSGRGDAARPVYCWPGLGGYPMNLRTLARDLDLGRPFHGVQAHGINAGETPYATIREMAARDIEEIRRHQPEGPYTLWGYSFGARVAFEAAHQLEQAGERVDHLFLLAPGAPRVRARQAEVHGTRASYSNEAFVRILYSVFSGTVEGPTVEKCLRSAVDDETFAAFTHGEHPHLDLESIRRIIRIVTLTFDFTYTFHELAERRVRAPVTIFKATGDDYAFIENSTGYAARPPAVVDLTADHYSMLKESGVGELVRAIRNRLRRRPHKESVVPHINIKHFPVALSEERQSELLTALTSAVREAFACEEKVISIALEPVEQEAWNEQVYIPEIVNRKELLLKTPDY
ncbi:amino acid adenylation domain-containing protein [Streptomyces sp. NPDC005925]|uniref:amino acid adenylation domain-containing protein n=1 Tax=Streptomyces sp. NPDC005925 TaxID=3157172 RepID=UPI0033D05311